MTVKSGILFTRGNNNENLASIHNCLTENCPSKFIRIRPLYQTALCFKEVKKYLQNKQRAIINDCNTRWQAINKWEKRGKQAAQQPWSRNTSKHFKK